MTLKSFWLNLPISDQAKAIRFYKGIGFEVDEPRNQSMVRISLGDNTIILIEKTELSQLMGLVEEKAEGRILISLDVKTDQEVDELAERVIRYGGKIPGEPSDLNGFYGFLFEDPDGHKFNVIAME